MFFVYACLSHFPLLKGAKGMLIINKQPAKISKKTLRTIFLLSLPTYKRQETYENLY